MPPVRESRLVVPLLAQEASYFAASARIDSLVGRSIQVLNYGSGDAGISKNVLPMSALHKIDHKWENLLDSQQFYNIVTKHDIQMISLLTAAQQRIAKAIAGFDRKNQPLFMPELIEKLGYAAESSLTPTLKILERKGVVEIIGGGKQRAYRMVRLTAKGRGLMGLGGGIPLLGSIPAGPLQEAIADPEEIMEVGDMLKHRAGDFLLRAAGDSMTGDGIFNGDLVLLRPQIEVQQGEIAAVHAGENFESTLKHVHFEKGQVRLRAGNPAYRDILIPLAEWRGVAGVFRGLVRNVHH